MTTMTRPVTAKQTWRDSARCLRVDPELFFPASCTSPEGQRQTSLALQVCANCPVLRQCREDILATEGQKQIESRHGIRGGLIPRQRLNIARQAARKAAT